MKLLFDENLSPSLPAMLVDLYPDSEHVSNVGMGSVDDADIWSFAKAYGFAVVTKDSDFANRSLLELDAPKIIWLRLGNCTTRAVVNLLRTQRDEINAFVVGRTKNCLILRA